MAIVKMDRISVIGLSTESDAVLSALQKIGKLEIITPINEELKFTNSSSAVAEIEQQMSQLERAIETLQTYAPQKGGMLASRRQVSSEEFSAIVSRREEIVATAVEIITIVDSMPAEGEEKAAAIAKLKDLSASRNDLELLFDRLNLRRDKLEAIGQVGQTEYTFLIEGYVPKKLGADVKKQLEEQFALHVELTAPTEEEDVPVAFKNNGFVSPVESITETYSMPSNTDVDPNPIMSFFYYLFFGMMFSDAGYGLMLIFVCGFLAFSGKLEKSRTKVFRMFFFCGISTFTWGMLFGSFFGNVVYSVSTSFLGREINLAPLWIDPIAQAMDLLMLSVALGILHILIALCIKFYTYCRLGKIVDALCDVACWILAISGIAAFAVNIFADIEIAGTIGMAMFIIGMTVLLVFGGRKNKGIVGKVLGGLPKLYSLTGYISDSLSYCRIMALALATGAIANVVNMLGTMFGNSVMGIALFIVIFLLGHSLNFAMNILGAYVHTNRLQYVEYFSKFYEGGGREFKPFSMNTKYTVFTTKGN